MSLLVLRYPPALRGYAVQCGAVGSLLNLEITCEEDGALKNLTMAVDRQNSVRGAAAICHYMVAKQDKRNACAEARLLQWTSFANSELRWAIYLIKTKNPHPQFPIPNSQAQAPIPRPQFPGPNP